jgi:formamidopyrimidine-DNA glycosylase
MPEMPEVETMVERLQKYAGYSIIAADGRHNRYLPDGDNIEATGQTIRGVYRRGKFIIFMLDRGALLCHNAMSGYWDSDDDRWTFDYVEGKRESRDSDIRASLLLCPSGKILSQYGVNIFFHDARKFGYIKYVDPEQLAKKLSSLGGEAVESKNVYEPRFITLADFFLACNSSKRPIKDLLMDQSLIAGVGNIYAAEACWLARINPFRPACELDGEQIEKLLSSIKNVLNDALERKLNYEGLRVYRRKVCGVCTGKIESKRLKGRSTYWCPTCQP